VVPGSTRDGVVREDHQMFSLWPKRETDEWFRLRMEDLQRHLTELPLRDPEEVAGTGDERIYYGLKASEALRAGQQDTARAMAEAMVRSAPTDSAIRHAAAVIYFNLGDVGETMAHLGIAIALDPDNYAPHGLLAHLLRHSGESEAADAVLEQAWLRMRKWYPRREHAARRAAYFQRHSHRITE